MSIRKLNFRLRLGYHELLTGAQEEPHEDPHADPPHTTPENDSLVELADDEPLRSPATAPEMANVTVERIRLRRIAFIRPGESMGRVLSPNHMMGCLFLRMKSPSNRLLTTMFPLLK